MQHVPNPEAEKSYLTSVAVSPLAPNLHRFRFRWLCVPNPEAEKSYPTSVAVSPLAPNLHRFRFRWLCPRSHPSKVDSRFKDLLLQRYVPAGGRLLGRPGSRRLRGLHARVNPMPHRVSFVCTQGGEGMGTLRVGPGPGRAGSGRLDSDLWPRAKLALALHASHQCLPWRSTR